MAEVSDKKDKIYSIGDRKIGVGRLVMRKDTVCTMFAKDTGTNHTTP